MTLCQFRFFLTLLVLITSTANSQNSTQSQKLDKLYSFAKAYGYLKYFYPGDRQQDFDWTRFAYFGTNEIIQSKDVDVALILNRLFKPIAPKAQIVYENKIIDRKKDELTVDSNAIYWQHLGDGRGSIGYPYKSMRVNRKAKILPESPNDFFTFSKRLDAEKLRGKTIKASLKFKADPFYIGRPAVLIMYREPGKDMKTISSEGQFISTLHWSTHEISFRLPDSLDRVYFFIQSVGMAGGLYVDDLQLSVINSISQTPFFSETFENLNTDSLKVNFRPSGPNQEFKIDTAENSKVAYIYRSSGILTEHLPLFHGFPKVTMMRLPIGAKIALEFPLKLYTSDTTDNQEDLSSYNKITRSLKLLNSASLSAENLSTRLANVIMVWNVIRHFHPMLSSGVNWESYLRNALKRSFTDSTRNQHAKTLTRMTDVLRDSHMSFYYSKIIHEDYYPPLIWDLIDNKLIVVNAADSIDGVKKGDIISSVNGVPAFKYWQESSLGVLAANDSRKRVKTVMQSLKGLKNSEMLLVVNGKTITVSRTQDEFNFNRNINETNASPFLKINTSIYYYDLTKISWEDLQKHLPEMMLAKGLIFDLRGYPQWQTMDIIRHFTSIPLKKMTYQIPAIIYPDGREWKFITQKIDTMFPKEPLIKAKKVFLTNGNALSYSEDFLQMIKFYGLADIVGEQTAGITGNTNNIYLLGGLYTPWSGMRVLTQNGKVFNGNGIFPDHAVTVTRRGIQLSKDEQLQYAIRLLELKK